MGVSQIWDIIRNSLDDNNVTFASSSYERVLLKSYLLENRPKIAIDAYQILFECGFFQFEHLGKPMLNLMKRLNELISLDVSFVFVFDGLEKPREKNGNGFINRSYPKFMSVIRQLFQLLNISMVQARGEGEVQCCILEAQEKVDLIWTNDSDSLLFGGNHIMKNYSKFETDIGVAPGASSPRRSGTDNSGTGKENFVTVFEYNELLKLYPTRLLDREGLLLFSVLLGADYHAGGVKGLGKEKAYQVASLKDPNFAHKFYTIFEPKGKQNNKNNWDIQYQYEQFQEELFAYCKNHSKELFGKNYSILLNNKNNNFDNWPPINVIRHYFHPLMDEDVDINEIFDEEKHFNVNGSVMYEEDINFNELKTFLQEIRLPQVTNFDKWFHDTMHEMCLLKYLLYNNQCGLKCKITEEKIVMINDNLNFIMKYWKVRYISFLIGVEDGEEETSSRSTSPTRSPTKRQLDTQKYKYGLWIPQIGIPDNHQLVVEYRERERERLKQEELEKKLKSGKKRSPKKRFANYKQKNNLDSFFTKHAYPVDKNVASLTLIRSGSSLSSTETENVKLNSMKKRLFIPSSSDEESELFDELAKDNKEVGDDQDSSLVILEETIIPRRQTTLNFKDNILQPNKINDTQIQPSPTKKHHMDRPILPSPVQIGKVSTQLSFNERDNKLGSMLKTVSDLSDEPTHIALNVSPVINRTATLNKPAPMLSRTDTFGYKKGNRSNSLLDKITLEGDAFLQQLENGDDMGNHSDASTVSTATSSSLSLD